MSTEKMTELHAKARKWQAIRDKSVRGPYTAWPDPEGRTIVSEADGAVNTSCSNPGENRVLAFLDCHIDDDKMEATAELMAASWEMLDAIAVLLAATEQRGKVAAWLHVLHMEGGQKTYRTTMQKDSPFGVRGEDYDPSYTVTATELYVDLPKPAVPDAKRPPNPLNRQLGDYEVSADYIDGWNACRDAMLAVVPEPPR